MTDEMLAQENAITARHEQMANGELRFRLMGGDGNGYIRTVAGEAGAWQNSHFHRQVRETYIVENGWMALAELDLKSGSCILSIFEEGGMVTTEVGRKHNVYLPAYAVIHTVKHSGRTGQTDWHAAPELDAITKVMTEAQILATAVRVKPRRRRLPRPTL